MTDKAQRALTAAGWISGWLLLSGWLAAVFGWSILLLTTGAALVAASGIRPLGLLLWHGVYFLNRRGPDA